MKLKYRFEKMEIDGEIVAIPVGLDTNELHAFLYLNEVAMRILDLLHEETTEQDIVSKLLLEYSGEKNKIEEAVHSFVNQLNQEGLLVNE